MLHLTQNELWPKFQQLLTREWRASSSESQQSVLSLFILIQLFYFQEHQFHPEV